jgi:hypothetical protein
LAATNDRAKSDAPAADYSGGEEREATKRGIGLGRARERERGRRLMPLVRADRRETYMIAK